MIYLIIYILDKQYTVSVQIVIFYYSKHMINSIIGQDMDVVTMKGT